MCQAAVALCAQERYRGAGTVEFVLDTETQRFYFLEMNTRIQVEHPVTEMVTGLDLVEMQIRLAGGQPLPVRAQTDLTTSGHSIECRIYAERPAKGFLPAPGVLSGFDVPEANRQVRIDTGVRAGDRVTHFYDPMIAKVIVLDADRSAAIERMLATLGAIAIEGVDTNLAFLRKVLAHAAFRAGDVRTAFVDRFKKDLL
jgi:3-methylcrotonyl-CoA carboxylase alpha subunit